MHDVAIKFFASEFTEGSPNPKRKRRSKEKSVRTPEIIAQELISEDPGQSLT